MKTGHITISALLVGVFGYGLAQAPGTFDGSIILGRPTDRSITLNVLANRSLATYVEYGIRPGAYAGKTGVAKLEPGKPLEIALEPLKRDTRYYYRLRYRQPGAAEYSAAAENSFHTQRPPGGTFTFGVQGDSHPERLDRMYRPDLYVRTIEIVRRDRPDFYIMLGDDFSVDQLYNHDTMNSETVGSLYSNQRRILGPMAASTSLFLVNGNHEQAAAYLLNGTPNSPPVLAGVARNLFFPNPAPDSFYSGDTDKVEGGGRGTAQGT